MEQTTEAVSVLVEPAAPQAEFETDILIEDESAFAAMPRQDC
ncbi:hypothetical protein [Dactylosporangium vinaceum]|uniref:Uncharacterized protein n=1 Tax=Dactylosporangium vinaceum TaxID=53362 RepID=A0ABV5MD41_9ACTN|nr:hypothetical protein [Dactylosporangium vinaceum]